IGYQWRLNGANIAGATASACTISNVQSANAGVYSVVVSNACGVVLSSDALLTMASCVLWTETFESGLANWTIVPVTNATALTNSNIQNHTKEGNNAAKVGNTLNKMYRDTGIEMAGNTKVTFWLCDSNQTRAFGEVRADSGSGYSSGSLQQIFA